MNQINDKFMAKDKTMASYLIEATKLLQCFDKFEHIQIPKEEKKYAEALSKFISSKDTKLFESIFP